jgi:sarcosine oxidase, subunit alpha
MLRRARAPANPVTIYLDGEPVVAERGEPLAMALLGADKVTLARSPKLHRPRAPSCLRGACDGCLARVDGEPNVMTCLRAALGGERIETQNVIGSRRADLLRVTDWFFPDGIDHHHLMAGVPGVQEVMQGFARKLAGLGRLPSEAAPPQAGKWLDVDVLVVGGGIAGCTAAATLAAAGKRVALVDDGLTLGGAARGDAGAAALVEEKQLRSVRVLSASTAVGAFATAERRPPFGEVLVATPDGGRVVRAGALVLAVGAHDPVLEVANNDLPGVFSARALARVVEAGVLPEGRVALVGDGFWARALVSMLGDEALLRVGQADLLAIRGTGRVRSVEIRAARKETRREEVALVAVDGPGAPAFELAAQAGAEVIWQAPIGYVPQRDAEGRAADGVWVTGECAGLTFAPEALAEDARRVAAAVVAAIGAR